MKKLLPLCLLMILSLFGYAQNFVSNLPEKGNVILEEYTGVNCGYCPEGHVIANNIKSKAPNDVVLINIHAGSFANPGTGQPDFRTDYGEAFASEMGVTGYPSGTVNRNIFGTNANPALNRGQWDGASQEQSAVASPVNVGINTNFDEASRELTINVDLYYTGSSTSASNFINVAFLENGYVGWQTDYTNGDDPNYIHNHILREMITGQWGDEVTETTEGTSVSRSYTYTVPMEYDINNCEVSAYVAESRRNIYNGHTVPANGGSTAIIGKLASGKRYFSGEVGQATTSSLTLTNELPNEETYTLNVTGSAPADWSTGVVIDGTVFQSGATVTIPAGQTKTFDMAITPGATVGIASFELEVISETFGTNAPSLNYSMNVIGGVKDLVVSNDESVVYGPYYETALAIAGNGVFAGTTRDVMNGFGAEGALSGVVNIYYNVGWTFPGLNDASVAVLADFMDNGGNVLIAGQDIGWDNFSGHSASNGTDITRNFYTNYMHAEYLDDGSTANSSITAVVDDNLFGNVGTANIIDIYGGSNIYPEELNPINDGKAIFNYDGGTKIGAVRAQTDKYKMVYLGFSLEQLDNTTVANQIIQIAHDWFYGLTSTNELSVDLSTMAYPNPTSDILNVSLLEGLSSNGNVTLMDLKGAVVSSQFLAKDQTEIQINVSNLTSGMYILELHSNSGVMGRTKVIVD